MILKGPWASDSADIFYAAKRFLRVYSPLFSFDNYLRRFDLHSLDSASQRLVTSCLDETSAIEEQFSARLNFLFGEDEKVRPLRSLERPVLQRALCVRDIHENAFEDAAHIQVFLEGHEVATSHYEVIDPTALERALSRIEAILGRVRLATLDYLDSNCHSLPGLLQQALAYEYGTRAALVD